jgi:hypothetical protein
VRVNRRNQKNWVLLSEAAGVVPTNGPPASHPTVAAKAIRRRTTEVLKWDDIRHYVHVSELAAGLG